MLTCQAVFVCHKSTFSYRISNLVQQFMLVNVRETGIKHTSQTNHPARHAVQPFQEVFQIDASGGGGDSCGFLYLKNNYIERYD